MPVVTVQLGQCGNQLGSSLFQSLGQELGTGEYQASGLEEWFRVQDIPGTARQRYVPRSVLIDMEPKVVSSVLQSSIHSKAWWRYPADRQLCMHSGAGNNWAHGFHGYGPRVRDAALDLVRKEVEACDVLGGFLLLQSMAGGTGAGLGTYVAGALRDEYPSSHAVNCCVWPYESGEVIVQAYNTLFTLSHLAQVSDGIILMENEALHRTAHRLYNIPRPSFQDMNNVAARSLAGLLLPSHHRSPGGGAHSHTATMQPAHSTSPVAHTSTTAAAQDSRLRRHSSSPSLAAGGVGPAAVGTDVSRVTDQMGGLSVASDKGRPVRLLSELVGHCTPHPGYRLLSLRALPQVPAQSVDFTTFTWPAITKRLRQMMITGSTVEEGLDWGVAVSSQNSATAQATPPPIRPAVSNSSSTTPVTATQHSVASHSTSLSTPGSVTSGLRSSSATPESHSRQRSTHSAAPGLARRSINKCVSSWLVLRGQGAGEVDVSGLFSDAALYAPWSVDPLAVSWHGAKYARCAMAATQLCADQACAEPCRRMQDRAYSMWASKAYVHQYESYGLTAGDFEHCFAQVEDVVERYVSM